MHKNEYKWSGDGGERYGVDNKHELRNIIREAAIHCTHTINQPLIFHLHLESGWKNKIKFSL